MTQKIFSQGTITNRILRIVNLLILGTIALHLIFIENLRFELIDMFAALMVLSAPILIFGVLFFKHATNIGKLLFIFDVILAILYLILLGEYFRWNEFVGRFEGYKEFYYEESGIVLIISNIILISNIFCSLFLYPTKK